MLQLQYLKESECYLSLLSGKCTRLPIYANMELLDDNISDNESLSSCDDGSNNNINNNTIIDLRGKKLSNNNVLTYECAKQAKVLMLSGSYNVDVWLSMCPHPYRI